MFQFTRKRLVVVLALALALTGTAGAQALIIPSSPIVIGPGGLGTTTVSQAAVLEPSALVLTPGVVHSNPAAGVTAVVPQVCVGCLGSIATVVGGWGVVASTVGLVVTSNTVVGGPTGLLTLPTGELVGLPVGPIVF
jgi:hypothetical protein